MQGKGIVKFFLVIMAIVCAIQYLLILPTRSVERKAEERAEAVAIQLGEDINSSMEAKRSTKRVRATRQSCG